MSHFLRGVADIVREEYRTAMLPDDVTLLDSWCMNNQLKILTFRGCL